MFPYLVDFLFQVECLCHRFNSCHLTLCFRILDVLQNNSTTSLVQVLQQLHGVFSFFIRRSFEVPVHARQCNVVTIKIISLKLILSEKIEIASFHGNFPFSYHRQIGVRCEQLHVDLTIYCCLAVFMEVLTHLNRHFHSNLNKYFSKTPPMIHRKFINCCWEISANCAFAKNKLFLF